MSKGHQAGLGSYELACSNTEVLGTLAWLRNPSTWPCIRAARLLSLARREEDRDETRGTPLVKGGVQVRGHFSEPLVGGWSLGWSTGLDFRHHLLAKTSRQPSACLPGSWLH